MKLLLVNQFTYIGSPNVWQGDEMGMWGADDPNNRKPLIWKDIKFENETHHPLNLERPTDKVEFNQEIFEFYQKLIQIRKENPVLALGEIEFVMADDDLNVLAYRRFDNRNEILVIFNNSNVPVDLKNYNLHGVYTDLLTDFLISFDDKKESVELAPKTAYILKPVK